MSVRFLFIIFFFAKFSFTYSQNTNFAWSHSIGGSSNDIGNEITTDVWGNVYSTGLFEGTVDFDPGPGVYNLSAIGQYDIFVIKLSTNGNLIWAKSIGGVYVEKGNSIAVDAFGNVYTTGTFSGTVDFNPGIGIDTITSAGSLDAFVLKFDNGGNYLWAKGFGGNKNEYSNSIKVDPYGNVLTTGTYFSAVNDFDPNVGVFTLNSAGDFDIFISKLDPSGNLIWAKGFGGYYEDVANSIAIDGVGNVYTTGHFEIEVDFDPGVNTHKLFTNTSIGGTRDLFISKLDAQGNFVWAKNFGGISWDDGLSIAIDGSGNVITTGFYQSFVDFDPGAGVFSLQEAGAMDVFILKLYPTGAFVWAKSLGGNQSEYATSVSLDAFGNVYTTGFYNGKADFNPDSLNDFYLNSNDTMDVFISKLDGNGNFVWAKSIGGISSDAGSSIAVDLDNSVYATGFFQQRISCNTDSLSLYSAGMNDIYLLKIEQDLGTDIQQLKNFENVSFYPNPFNVSAVLQFNKILVRPEFLIYNSFGTRIEIKKTMTQNEVIIERGNLKSGIYYYELKDNFRSISRGKFIVSD